MKKLILVSVVLALGLSFIPAMAGDKAPKDKQPAAFQALHNMPALERTALKPMTDKELASIEGKSFFFSFQENFTTIFQTNLGGGFQSNSAFVDQLNAGFFSDQFNSAFVSQANIDGF